LAVLSKLMTWAEDQGLSNQVANPCQNIERYRENKRERYLSSDELQRLGDTLRDREAAGENLFVIGLIQMLILTGARLSEMLTLRWDYVDTQRGLLRLPDSKTGAKTIRLNQAAKDVLARLPRLAKSPWVFPGHRQGQHLVNIQKPWRSIRAEAGLADVRLHDLRHSFASVAVEMGGSLPLIGHLLGHSKAQTTARYAHVAPSPAQEVAEATGRRIEQAMAKRPEKPESRPGLRDRLRRRIRPAR
jgi:integrase